MPLRTALTLAKRDMEVTLQAKNAVALRVKSMMAGALAGLPHVLLVALCLLLRDPSRPIAGDVLSVRFYSSALDFIVPWGFLAFAFLGHLAIAISSVRRHSISLAFLSAGVMAGGYAIAAILFAVAGLPDKWATG